jgi:hypothetical protein
MFYLKIKKARVFYGSFKNSAEIAWKNATDVKNFLNASVLKKTTLSPSTLISELKGVTDEGAPEISPMSENTYDLPDYLVAFMTKDKQFCAPYLLTEDALDYYDYIDYKQNGLIQIPRNKLVYAEQMFKTTKTTPAAHTLAFFLYVLNTGGEEVLKGSIDPSMIYQFLFDPKSILPQHLKTIKLETTRLVQLLNRLGGSLATKTTLMRFNKLTQLNDITVIDNNLYPSDSIVISDQLTIYSKGGLRNCSDTGYNVEIPFIESKNIITALMGLYDTYIPLGTVVFLKNDNNYKNDRNVTESDVVIKLLVAGKRPPGTTDWLLAQKITTKSNINFTQGGQYNITSAWNNLFQQIIQSIHQEYSTLQKSPPFSGYDRDKKNCTILSKLLESIFGV